MDHGLLAVHDAQHHPVALREILDRQLGALQERFDQRWRTDARGDGAGVREVRDGGQEQGGAGGEAGEAGRSRGGAGVRAGRAVGHVDLRSRWDAARGRIGTR
ncbi:MAG: hypothetical protein WD336_01560 [Trueperaceae bacterium]